jgi:hypothetical protein
MSSIPIFIYLFLIICIRSMPDRTMLIDSVRLKASLRRAHANPWPAKPPTENRLVAGLVAASAAASIVPALIQDALATPAATVTGTTDDIQRIVIFMQENRAIDHYYGTLRGANGFLRLFGGDVDATAAASAVNLEIRVCYDVANSAVYLTLMNSGKGPWTFTVAAESVAEMNWSVVKSTRFANFSASCSKASNRGVVRAR